MSEKEIYEKLNEVFQDVFMDDSIMVSAGTTASNVEDWDSLMHITLVSEVEKAFQIKLDARSASNLKNVGEMVAIIKRLKENE